MSTHQTDQESRFRLAAQLSEAGDLIAAKSELSALAEQSPDNATIWAKLGFVCWELEEGEAAVDAFRKAAVLKPESETASLALFHTLWEHDEHEAALEEAKRFLSLKRSDEYTMILAELSAKRDD